MRSIIDKWHAMKKCLSFRFVAEPFCLTQCILPLLLMNSLSEGALFDGVKSADEQNFSLFFTVSNF